MSNVDDAIRCLSDLKNKINNENEKKKNGKKIKWIKRFKEKWILNFNIIYKE